MLLVDITALLNNTKYLIYQNIPRLTFHIINFKNLVWKCWQKTKNHP